MKNKSLIHFAMAIALSSCSQIHDPDPGLSSGQKPDHEARYDGNSVAVSASASDIANVVAGFRGNGEPLARGAAGYTTEVINDRDGNPAIHVVNYSGGGFMLVSAKKTYSPVLAFSDEGRFNVAETEESGLSLWWTETVEAVRQSEDQPAETVAAYRAEWRKYEPRPAYTLSASGSPEDEYYQYYQQAVRILMDSMSVWQSNGYEIVDLNGDFMGDEQQSQFIREQIEGLILPIYLDYTTTLSVGLRKTKRTATEYPNFVLSRWHQDEPFNMVYPYVDGVQAPAGCGPVAAGQIMKYYEHPARYNWSQMNKTLGSDYTSSFLYDIAIAANAQFNSDATSTTINSMHNVFVQFGYNCQLYQSNPFQHSLLKTNISRQKPVYIRGDNGQDGHAWIVSGYKGVEEEHKFEIYSFPYINELRSIMTVEAKTYKSDYYYMNWGWGDGRNGYYYIRNNEIENAPYQLRYNYKAIWNINPKK